MANHSACLRRYAGVVALTLVLGFPHPLPGQRVRPSDPRLLYDVLTYRLHFTVRPDSQRLNGTNEICVRWLSDKADSLVLDAGERLRILSAEMDGSPAIPLQFRKWGQRLSIALPGEVGAGARLKVRIHFSYSPGQGFEEPVQFDKTDDGKPWINTSCQLVGAHQWWPCKASFFHPEDKPDSVWISLTFPDTLYGIANGRFLGADSLGGWKTTHWLVVHPRLTYLIALYIGPYSLLTQRYESAFAGKTVLNYYVLSKDTARARAEFFPRIPELVKCYERWFGPFAFWDEKFALVQSSIPGMEHSTAVAVGPIFPHTLRPGEPNPLSWYEEYFNYMAIHETAHEWWGNAVSARDWGEFWLHEAFATYAEALWVEHIFGPEVMHQYMAKLSFRIDSLETVYRPRHADAREAYHLNIYYKGAWILHMLRYVMGDSGFFAALREYNCSSRLRYANASTSDFQSICERLYGGDLSWFFLEWVYRPGWPRIDVQCIPAGRKLKVVIRDTCFVPNAFRMPVDLRVETDGGNLHRRVWAEPGRQQMELDFPYPVRRAEPTGLRWILDGPKAGELWYFTDLDFIKGEFLHQLEFTEDRQIRAGSDSACWVSPVRSLFPGAKWLRIRIDRSIDPRHAAIRVQVREPSLLRREEKPWLPVPEDGSLPLELRGASRLRYRLEFGALRGQKLPLPKVVLEYSR